MNEALHPDSGSDVSWPGSDPRMRAPDTSTLPVSEMAPPAAALGMLKHAAQGAHDSIDDRVADRAAPAVRRIDDGVSAAGQTLQATTGQLRDARDHRVEGARSTVRRHPLAWVAGAFALGAAIARLVPARRWP